jgi:hypothetical protein
MELVMTIMAGKKTGDGARMSIPPLIDGDE